MLAKLDGVARENWTDEFLNGTFAFANVCGALNTLGRGAIDHLPTLEQVTQILNKNKVPYGLTTKKTAPSGAVFLVCYLDLSP